MLNQIFGACATYAYSTLSRIGALFLDNHIPYEALEWAVKGEKVYNFYILRWLLSFHFEFALPLFINKSYQLSTISRGDADSGNTANYYTHAIFDQFTIITNNDVKQTEIYEQYIRYIRTSERLADIMPKREVQPLTQSDQIFSHIVSNHAGLLILFLFLNLDHPIPEIRSKSFKVITRLVCTNFGKDSAIPKSEKSIQLKKELSEYEDSFHSQLMNSNIAKIVSKITAKSCIISTEQVFKEAFHRIGKLQSQNLQHWLLNCCILPWCDNISLSANLKESTIPSYPPDEFLQNIFTHLTLSLVKFDCKLSAEVIQIWQRLSTETNNHKMIVDFLLHQGISSTSNMMICKTLVLYLFKDTSPSNQQLKDIFSLSSSESNTEEHKKTLLCDLIFPLSFYGVLGEEYSLWDSKSLHNPLSGDLRRSGNNVNNYYLEISALFDIDYKELRESKLRQGVIEVLIDFIIDSIDLLLPHIHILLTWSLMLLNDSTEADYKILTKLLYTVLITLKVILQTNNLNSTELTEQFEYICKMFESDLPFRLVWSFDKYKKEPLISTNHNSYYSITSNPLTKSNQSTLILSTLPTDIFSNHHIQIPQLIHGKQIVNCIHGFFELIGANDINLVWANEVLKWAIFYKDPSISVICFDIYKNLKPSYSVDTVKLLIKSLTDTISQLQKFTDHFFIIHSNSSFFSQGVQGNPSSDDLYLLKKKVIYWIVLSRGKIQEIFETLSLFIPNLIEDNQIELLYYLYWVIISIIRVSHPIFEPLHITALKMLITFFDHNLFNIKYKDIYNSQLSHFANDPEWNYSSIEQFIIYHIYNPKTEKFALQVFLLLLSIQSGESLITSNNDHTTLLIFAILPWLHSKLLLFVSSNSPSSPSIVRFFLSYFFLFIISDKYNHYLKVIKNYPTIIISN